MTLDSNETKNLTVGITVILFLQEPTLVSASLFVSGILFVATEVSINHSHYLYNHNFSIFLYT